MGSRPVESNFPPKDRASESRPFEILIADDHPLVAEGMARVLDSAPEFDVTEVVSDLGGLRESLSRTPPDALVVDIDMPGMTIFSFLRQIRRELPELPVLVVSAMSEDVYALRTLKAGARGFVPKSAAVTELEAALRVILSGRRWLGMALGPDVQGSAHGDLACQGLESLTPRELEVFRLLGKGLTAREAGEALHISHRTVASHRLRIYHKLGIDSVSELIRLAKDFLESRKGP